MITAKQRMFRGLLIGEDTDIAIRGEEGLEALLVRDGDRELPRLDGSTLGLHLRQERTITLDLLARGPDPDAAVAEAMSLFAVSREMEFEYRFTDRLGVESFVRARPVRFEVARTNDTEHSALRPMMAALKVRSPFVYSVEQFSELVPTFGATSGGYVFPGEFPFAMGAAAPQLATAVNTGADNAFPVVTFQYVSGTVSAVELTNLTTGVVLDIDTTITSGQQLIADMDALVRATGDSVVRIGTASRYGDWQLPRDVFYLAPGSNSLRFEVTGGGEAVCLVRWRSTS